jgi:endonuclease G
VPACPFCYEGNPRGAVDEILVNKAYCVGYSDLREDPLWVSYRVRFADDPASCERPSRFLVDARTKAKVSHDDYTGSGYDRGHMAPNATIAYAFGCDAQRETFLMSNVCPQTPTLNRGIWAQLEDDEREWEDEFGDLWVCTGPIFEGTIEALDSGVEIPDAFYKIIVDETGSTIRVLAFIIPQNVPAGAELGTFLTTVDEIETRTGFDFLWALDDATESVLESTAAAVVW